MEGVERQGTIMHPKDKHYNHCHGMEVQVDCMPLSCLSLLLPTERSQLS